MGAEGQEPEPAEPTLAEKYPHLVQPPHRPKPARRQLAEGLSIGWQIAFWSYLLPAAAVLTIPLAFLGLWWIPAGLGLLYVGRIIYVYGAFLWSLRKR